MSSLVLFALGLPPFDPLIRRVVVCVYGWLNISSFRSTCRYSKDSTKEKRRRREDDFIRGGNLFYIQIPTSKYVIRFFSASPLLRKRTFRDNLGGYHLSWIDGPLFYFFLFATRVREGGYATHKDIWEGRSKIGAWTGQMVPSWDYLHACYALLLVPLFCATTALKGLMRFVGTIRFRCADNMFRLRR